MTAHRMQFPDVPGKTPREKFENLARMMFAVPKAEIEEKKRPKKRRKTAAAIAGFLAVFLFSGCLTAARKQIAPDSWVRADSGAPATQADTDQCRSYLKGTSLDNLDAHLTVFRECMRDHGFKMK